MILKQLISKSKKQSGIRVHIDTYGLYREDHRERKIKCWSISKNSDLNLKLFEYEMKGYTVECHRVPLEFFAYIEFLLCEKPEGFDRWLESQKRDAVLRKLL